VVFLGNMKRLVTTGVSRWNTRQIALWDQVGTTTTTTTTPAMHVRCELHRCVLVLTVCVCVWLVWGLGQEDLAMPMVEEEIDGLSGLLFPFYDADTHMLYLAGKVRKANEVPPPPPQYVYTVVVLTVALLILLILLIELELVLQGDGNIRYFEITSEKPYLQYLMEYRSPAPQKGLGESLLATKLPFVSTVTALSTGGLAGKASTPRYMASAGPVANHCIPFLLPCMLRFFSRWPKRHS